MPFDSTVHVIDDDEALRDSLTFLLRTARLDVLSYPSAAAFLDALPGAKLSCVITDVRMPGMSGIDLLRHLRERKISVPVIVITGHGDIPLAVEAMRIGAIDFLEKPFDDEVLIASVKAALRQKEGEAKRHGERAEIESRIAALSNRERDVLGGLVAGRANKQIAFRSQHQPAHRGDLPRQPDEQDAGGKPVRSGAHGAHRRDRWPGMKPR
jgi:two-component system, LuxR family, response regulator FixJ